jgi:hypothetical protein
MAGVKFTLPVYDIEVEVGENGSASINSNLPCDEVPELDGITSLILAHAAAGVDIEAPEYVKGVETAVDAVVNNID